MLHRVIFGSIERFIGILIEQYAGAFPTWLAPVQVKILTIADRHVDYAKKLMKEMSSKGIRVELDDREEKMGYKIREAQLQKVPYMLIIGDKEVEENKVSMRSRDKGDLGSIEKEKFIEKVEEEIKNLSK